MIAPPEPDQKNRTSAPILVVDDDDAILDVVVTTLNFRGFTTQAAHHGAEGLELLEEERPGLILLDMRMPVLDGWGFAQALREREIDVPVIVMTAARDARRWAEEINADAYLEKPFNLVDLMQTVDRVLAG